MKLATSVAAELQSPGINTCWWKARSSNPLQAQEEAKAMLRTPKGRQLLAQTKSIGLLCLAAISANAMVGITAAPANAGCGYFDVFCKGSGIRKGLRSIDVLDKNSDVRKALRGFDEEFLQPVGDAIGEGIKSAAKVCMTAGAATCANPDFQATYITLKTIPMSGADMCGALVESLVAAEPAAITAVSAAFGYPMPPQVGQISAKMHREHGMLSCQILYGRQPNLNGYTRTNEGVLVKTEGYERVIGQAIGAPRDATTQASPFPSSPPGPLAGGSLVPAIRDSGAESVFTPSLNTLNSQAEALRLEQESRSRIAQENLDAQRSKQEMTMTLINSGAALLGNLLSNLGRPSSEPRPPAPIQQASPYPQAFGGNNGSYNPSYPLPGTGTVSSLESDLKSVLGLTLDPTCSNYPMVIKGLGGQVVCAVARPPHSPGLYLFNGSTLVPLR